MIPQRGEWASDPGRWLLARGEDGRLERKGPGAWRPALDSRRRRLEAPPHAELRLPREAAARPQSRPDEEVPAPVPARVDEVGPVRDVEDIQEDVERLAARPDMSASRVPKMDVSADSLFRSVSRLWGLPRGETARLDRVIVQCIGFAIYIFG